MIFVILFLALLGFIAISTIVQSQNKLKLMKNKINEFENKHFSSKKEKDEAKKELKKELVAIKSKISIADKQSTEKATDIINIL